MKKLTLFAVIFVAVIFGSLALIRMADAALLKVDTIPNQASGEDNASIINNNNNISAAVESQWYQPQENNTRYVDEGVTLFPEHLFSFLGETSHTGIVMAFDGNRYLFNVDKNGVASLEAMVFTYTGWTMLSLGDSQFCAPGWTIFDRDMTIAEQAKFGTAIEGAIAADPANSELKQLYGSFLELYTKNLAGAIVDAAKKVEAGEVEGKINGYIEQISNIKNGTDVDKVIEFLKIKNELEPYIKAYLGNDYFDLTKEAVPGK